MMGVYNVHVFWCTSPVSNRDSLRFTSLSCIVMCIQLCLHLGLAQSKSSMKIEVAYRSRRGINFGSYIVSLRCIGIDVNGL